MLSKKQFIDEEKECSKMMGMSLKEYRNYCKNVKICPTNDSKTKTVPSFLQKIGIEQSKLKLRKEL